MRIGLCPQWNLSEVNSLSRAQLTGRVRRCVMWFPSMHATANEEALVFAALDVLYMYLHVCSRNTHDSRYTAASLTWCIFAKGEKVPTIPCKLVLRPEVDDS